MKRLILRLPNSRLRRTPSGLMALVAAIGVVLSASSALSCGYHNSADVARGLLNWVYPKALYVRTAVWQAERTGILRKRQRKAGSNPLRYLLVAKQLEKLAALLPPSADPSERVSFSVVLLSSVLWTNFSDVSGKYRAQVHSTGPRPGEVVVVTDEPVIAALVSGHIDSTVAERHGLLRFYGDEAEQEAVKKTLATISKLGIDVRLKTSRTVAGGSATQNNGRQ